MLDSHRSSRDLWGSSFVVEELSPEGQSPRPPIFERSYRYFDEDAEEWYDRRLVVYRIGGAS